MSDQEPVTPQGLAYSTLSVDDQKSLLLGRIKQVEAEHFSHSTNLRILEDNGQPNAEEVDRASREAMVNLEAAHATLTKQLAELE